MVEEYGSDISGIVMVSKVMGRRSIAAKLVSKQEISWLCRSKMLIVLAIASLASAAVGADDKPLVRFLSAAVKEDGSITYSITGEVDLLLSFIGTPATDKPTELEFYVTPFVGEQGDNLAVTPYIVELPDLKPEDQRLKFPLDRPVMTLKLKVPELPAAGKYSGSLVVLQDGQVRQTHPIVLTRARAQRLAKISVDLTSITIHHTKSWVPSWLPSWLKRCVRWFRLPTSRKELPSFTILVRNQSPDWQAKGVFLRLLEVTTPAGVNFDPNSNLTFTWNSRRANDLWRTALPQDTDASPHVISPNHQAEIGGEFRDLVPGEYTIKLGIAAANAEAEQQMTLKVRVRHSVIGAGIVLLLAIAISFIATKGLEAQRRRVAVLKKISELRPPWLREEPPTAPLVSARAILKQAEDRSKSWHSALLGPDVVSDRVNKAEQMAEILHQVHRIRDKINKLDHPMVRYRAEKRLMEATEDLDHETVDDNLVKKIGSELDMLNKWFAPDGDLFKQYWSDVKGRIVCLLDQFKLQEFEQKYQTNSNITSLLQSLKNHKDKNATPPNDLEEALKIDENYAKLKILWECLQNGEPDDLRELVMMPTTHSIESFFAKRNEKVWGRLETACEQEGGLEFTSPQEKSTIYPVQTYELIKFEVEPKDRTLGNNYLFKSGLEYHWSLDMDRSGLIATLRKLIRELLNLMKGKKPDNLEKLTRPKTTEPRLVQYVPVKGKLHASVKLCHNGKWSKAVKMKDPLPIKKSSDFSWIGTLRLVDVISLLIAALFALISGLATYYIGKPSFGIAADYITLFIWGAGVDQTKNFIQHLAQSSATRGLSS